MTLTERCNQLARAILAIPGQVERGEPIGDNAGVVLGAELHRLGYFYDIQRDQWRKMNAEQIAEKLKQTSDFIANSLTAKGQL